MDMIYLTHGAVKPTKTSKPREANKMTALQMLAKLTLSEKTTVGEGKRIVKFYGKILKGQKLTLTEFNFVTKLYNKYC